MVPECPSGPWPPIMLDRMSAMPTASVGAPPVRDSTVFRRRPVRSFSMSGVTVKPQPEITCAAVSGVVPISAVRAVHCEIEARFERSAAISAIIATKRFHQHPP